MSLITSSQILDQQLERIVQVAVDETKAAGTYTLLTATNGPVLITHTAFYQVTVAATFTSMQIQTSSTTPKPLVGSGSEGLVGNLLAGKNIQLGNAITPIYLDTGQTIQQLMAGSTGSGSGLLTLIYRPVVAGALLL